MSFTFNVLGTSLIASGTASLISTASVTVNIGQTMPDTEYHVGISPVDSDQAGMIVANRTTTTFDIVSPVSTTVDVAWKVRD